MSEAMTQAQKSEVAKAMEEAVLARVYDPAGWMAEIRRVVEAAGLSPATAVPLGCRDLRTLCFSTATCMQNHGLSAERALEAARR